MKRVSEYWLGLLGQGVILNTPIHKLDRLGKELGLKNLYIKRDDLTDFYGNKTRHIFYIIKYLRERNITQVRLIGNHNSNCVRIYAMALKRYGFDITFELKGEPVNWNSQLIPKISQSGHNGFELRYDRLKDIAAQGFVEASKELKKQLPDVDYIYLYSYDASWIGLSIGCFMNGMNPIIVAVRNVGGPHGSMGTWSDINYMQGVKESICEQYKVDHEKIPKADLREIGGNFPGMVTEMLNIEGILLDPVYTGRALWVLKGDTVENKIDPDSKVLFWHTGGIFGNV